MMPGKFLLNQIEISKLITVIFLVGSAAYVCAATTPTRDTITSAAAAFAVKSLHSQMQRMWKNLQKIVKQ
jgi:hypothetical protein